VAEQEAAAEEMRKHQAERAAIEREIALMSAEDHPALDLAEIEEIRRKMREEEEAARRIREA